MIVKEYIPTFVDKNRESEPKTARIRSINDLSRIPWLIDSGQVYVVRDLVMRDNHVVATLEEEK